jgi:c-di-AMP phosphodiesterase-like protein
MSKNMTKITLLIKDDYIDSFMQELPRDKVVVVEEDFNENIEKLTNVLKEYNSDRSEFISYYDSMKNIKNWLEQR